MLLMSIPYFNITNPSSVEHVLFIIPINSKQPFVAIMYNCCYFCWQIVFLELDVLKEIIVVELQEL